MNKEELIKEFNNTKFICGVKISREQQCILKYAAIRLETLDEEKDQQIAELQAESEKLRKDIKANEYKLDVAKNIVDNI